LEAAVGFDRRLRAFVGMEDRRSTHRTLRRQSPPDIRGACRCPA